MSRVHIIENATSGSQNIIIKQGSGATVTIGNGNVKIVYLDGAGSGAAVTDALIDLELADVASATIASVDINGGSIDGTTIGASSAAAGTFTDIVSNGKTVGTQSIVSSNPTSASGFPDGHVFYVIS
jgi:hypothetical protein